MNAYENNTFDSRGLDIADMISAGAYKLVQIVERVLVRS